MRGYSRAGYWRQPVVDFNPTRCGRGLAQPGYQSVSPHGMHWVIFAFEPRTGPVGALQLTPPRLAGLTGPGPALVAPFFIGRARFDRSRRRAVQAAVLSIGALVEIAVFWHPPGRSAIPRHQRIFFCCALFTSSMC